MTLKTSLLITGDSSTAQKAVEDLARSVDALNSKSRTTATALDAQDKAQGAAASSAADLAASGTQAARTTEDLGAAALDAGHALESVAASAGQAATTAAEMAAAGSEAARSTEDLGTAALAAGRALDELQAELAASRAQADQAAAGILDLQKANATLGAAVADADRSLTEMQGQLAALRGQADQAAAGIIDLEKANATLAFELDASRKSVAQLSTQLDVLETRSQSSTKAHGEASKSLGNVGIAAAETEHAVRAFADSVNAGQDPIRAFTLELPRLTQAAGFMGGALGAVGEFLGGPWGIALTVGVSVLAPFVEHLFESKTAAEQSKDALADLANEQKMLASAIDQANGKLAEQNRLQGLAAALSAPKTIAEGNAETNRSISAGFKAARSTASALAPSELNIFATISGDQIRAANALSDIITKAGNNFGTLVVGVNALAASSGNPAIAKLRDNLNDLNVKAVHSNDGVKQLVGAVRDYNIANAGGVVLTKDVVAQQIQLATANDASSKAAARLAIAQSKLNDLFNKPSSDARDAAIKSAQADVIAAQKAVDLIQSASKTRTSRPKQIADPTAGIDALTNQATSDIAQYGAAPTFLSKANEELAKLQQGLDKLDKIKPRSPLDVEKIADAKALLEQAGAVITANLDKPYQDFLRSQTQSLEVLRLQAAGQTDQAAALQQIIALQEKMEPLDADHVAQIEASVEKLDDARKAQERLNTARQQDLSALSSIQEQITGILSGTTSLASGAKGIFSSFKELAGAQAFQSLFGDSFEQLRDQVAGGARGVTAELKAAIAAVKPPTNDLRDNVVSAAAAAANFAEAVNAAASKASGGDAGYNLGGLTSSLNGSLASSASNLVATNPDLFPGIETPIVVAAKKIDDAGTTMLSATQLFNTTGSRVLTGIGATLKNFIGVDLKKALGEIGSYLGDALKGAGIGAATGSVLGLDKTGSALGGALGNILGKSGIGASLSKGITSAIGGQLGSALGNAVPVVGSIIGSIAGGLLGKLFSSTPKGGATITDTTSAAVLSGNSKQLEAQAGSLASSVQSGISKIAQQLGGIAGAFSGITIGEYKDSYRVNTVSTKLGGSSSPVPGLTAYDTADQAVAAAIQAAVAKGAVSGLDAAVQKALSSSSDLDTALQEALGVQNLEYALKGPAGAIQKIFDTFNQAAAENVRLAKTYGLDLQAVEKKNADDRTKLINDTLKQEVGSLQDLITSMTSGADFEGTALDKIAALNTQIDKAKADLAAGVDGAGDTLASLYQQRLDASKDAYGTTSAYATDRASTIADAQAAIAAANAKITAAAGVSSTASDPALATTNAALDENNDLVAQSNSLLSQIATAVGSPSSSSSTVNTNQFLRAVDLR